MDCTIDLSEIEVEKDLGVFIDHKLSFKNHVAQVTAKANKVVGVIWRSFDYLSEDLFLQLYKSLVRPLLEYGHSVWQPYQKTLCAAVEDVQRRATKLLPSISNKSYPERLAALRLPSLEHRRARGDMIDLFKYVHCIYKVQNPMFELADYKSTRGHQLKIKKAYCRLQVRHNSFPQRAINTWNSLPEEVVTAPTLSAFKSRLDALWFDLPSKYGPTCYH